jgi:ribonuclease P protein component
MIPKTRRLPLSRTSKFSGRRFSGRFTTLLTAFNQLPHYRAAIIIPKKIISLAVDRHHLKRLLAPTLLTSPVIGKSQDWLIILKPLAAKVSPNEVVADLTSLIKQASVE